MLSKSLPVKLTHWEMRKMPVYANSVIGLITFWLNNVLKQQTPAIHVRGLSEKLNCLNPAYLRHHTKTITKMVTSCLFFLKHVYWKLWSAAVKCNCGMYVTISYPVFAETCTEHEHTTDTQNEKEITSPEFVFVFCSFFLSFSFFFRCWDIVHPEVLHCQN